MNKNIKDNELEFTSIFKVNDVQSFAKINFGRNLSFPELNRLKKAWVIGESASSAKYELLYAAIEDALDDNQFDINSQEML